MGFSANVPGNAAAADSASFNAVETVSYALAMDQEWFIVVYPVSGPAFQVFAGTDQFRASNLATETSKSPLVSLAYLSAGPKPGIPIFTP